MIISKLQGGLGNQMFQYAVARGLCLTDDKVYLDHQFLEKNNADNEHFTARTFELCIFKNLKVSKANRSEINLLTSQKAYFKGVRFLLNYRSNYIRHHENEYLSLSNLSPNANVYLDGYFQSEKYFKHVRPQLLNEFTFPRFDAFNESLKQTILKAPNAVSIHVRRGDYLKSEEILNIHGVLPFSYYQKALHSLESSCSNLELFVFSEDIEWAKATFEGYNAHFFDHNRGANSWKDMALMTCCKHHIIANSSFSWWAAWLSKNNGDVFAPSAWFNPLNVVFKIQDFIPDNWIVLEC
jgi:hypothetical protein